MKVRTQAHFNRPCTAFIPLILAYSSSMSAEAPDPKVFRSWEDAFQYPIPAVRGMERQLRRDIDSNREKLRTLVGYVAVPICLE